MPEVANVSRWEQRDRPLLERYLNQEIPGVKIAYANANGDADVQQTQAGQMLAEGACILIVAAQDSVKAATIVQLAGQRNVPVIAYDRLIHDNDLAFYVSFNNVESGELQGKWIAAHAPPGAQIAMINGAPTDHSAQMQQEGVMNRLRPLIERGDMKLVYELFTPNWNSQLAASSVAQVLDTHQNNIQVICVANDDMANAVIAVLESRGLAGHVLVTGQDATVDGVRNVLAGSQGMTVFKDPKEQALNAARVAGAMSRGEDLSALSGKSIRTQTGAEVRAILATPLLVTRDNVKQVVLESGLITEAQLCVSAASACP
jgi:D-xylose transport system substrate-binding protein